MSLKVFKYQLSIPHCQLLILISLSEVSTNTHTKNFFNSIGDPDDISDSGGLELKIALNPKYLRYFIGRREDDTLLFYGDYSLHSVSTTDDLAGQVSNILSKDTFLNKAFDTIKICWSTDFEIIPAIFFDENEMAIDTGCNVIMGGEANFIFDVPAAVNDLLKNKFGTIAHYHSGAVLIETLREQGLAKSDKLFINIQAENIEVVYFDDAGSLRIYNRYEYKINREEVKAVLMGEVSQDSQLFEITYRYFRNISFVNKPGNINFSRAFGEYPKYFNYPLYNL
jgi:hypothetical protein